MVMNIEKHYLVILTPAGEFLKAEKNKRKYELGEEIIFSPIEMKKNGFLPFQNPFRVVASAAIVLIILFALLIPSTNSSKAYAYVSVDINPSVEMTLDKKGEVLKVISYNDEGKKVLSKLKEWKKKSVINVTEQVVQISKSLGYMKDHHNVLIATTYTKNTPKETRQEIEKSFHTYIQKATQNKEFKYEFIESKESIHSQAAEKGLSIGKYMKQKDQNLGTKQTDRKKMDDSKSNESKSKENSVSNSKNEGENQNTPKENKLDDSPKPETNKNNQKEVTIPKNKSSVDNKKVPTKQQAKDPEVIPKRKGKNDEKEKAHYPSMNQSNSKQKEIDEPSIKKPKVDKPDHTKPETGNFKIDTPKLTTPKVKTPHLKNSETQHIEPIEKEQLKNKSS